MACATCSIRSATVPEAVAQGHERSGSPAPAPQRAERSPVRCPTVPPSLAPRPAGQAVRHRWRRAPLISDTRRRQSRRRSTASRDLRSARRAALLPDPRRRESNIASTPAARRRDVQAARRPSPGAAARSGSIGNRSAACLNTTSARACWSASTERTAVVARASRSSRWSAWRSARELRLPFAASVGIPPVFGRLEPHLAECRDTRLGFRGNLSAARPSVIDGELAIACTQMPESDGNQPLGLGGVEREQRIELLDFLARAILQAVRCRRAPRAQG